MCGSACASSSTTLHFKYETHRLQNRQLNPLIVLKTMANTAVAAAATYTEAKINKWNNRRNKVLFFIGSNSSNRMSARHTSHEQQNKRASFTPILLISSPQLVSIFCSRFLHSTAYFEAEWLKHPKMNCKRIVAGFDKLLVRNWMERKSAHYIQLLNFVLPWVWLDAHDFSLSLADSLEMKCMLAAEQLCCCYFSPDFISAEFNYVLNWTLLRCLSIANFHRFDFVCFVFYFLLPMCFHVIFSHDRLSFQWGRRDLYACIEIHNSRRLHTN